ncbi:MAG: hypothetical protein AAFY88_32240, partial [Acidobacteriota bacterium]
TYGAGWVVLAVRLVDTAMVIALGRALGLSLFFEAALALLFAVCCVGFIDYRFNTNPKTAKRMAVYAGLYIVAFDVILAIELVRRYGLTIAGMEVAP